MEGKVESPLSNLTISPLMSDLFMTHPPLSEGEDGLESQKQGTD